MKTGKNTECWFVGTGGAFDTDYGNSALLIKTRANTILIDCGSTVFHELKKANMLMDIDEILITHLHDDHCGSLSSLIAYIGIFRAEKKVTLRFTTNAFREKLLLFLELTLGDPLKYVELLPLDDLPGIDWIETTGSHTENMLSHSYIIHDDENILVYSGDLGECDVLLNELTERSFDGATVLHEVWFSNPIRSHCHYKDLMKWRNRFKIFGYHCDPEKNPPDNLIPLVYNDPNWLMVQPRES